MPRNGRNGIVGVSSQDAAAATSNSAKLGVAATNLTSTYSLFFLALGPALQLLGWLALPGALWRRLLVIIPAEVAALTLLAGPDFTGAFAVLLACWLFVRHRPGISYLVLLAPVLVSFILKQSLHN